MIVRVDETRMNDAAVRIDTARRAVVDISVSIGSDPEYRIAPYRYRSTIEHASRTVQRHHDAVSNQNVTRDGFSLFDHLLDRHALFLDQR